MKHLNASSNVPKYLLHDAPQITCLMKRLKILALYSVSRYFCMKHSQGTCLMKHSQGTYLMKQSQDTYLMKQSQGTCLNKQSQGTCLLKQSQGTCLMKPSQGTCLKQLLKILASWRSLKVLASWSSLSRYLSQTVSYEVLASCSVSKSSTFFSIRWPCSLRNVQRKRLRFCIKFCSSSLPVRYASLMFVLTGNI